MFTGLVREIGRIAAVRRREGGTSLDVDAPATARRLSIGDSVAVDGVCLTVTRLSRSRFEVDLSSETLRATTAASWRAGRRVHLEPALTAADPIGGHFVLGHVDGVGRVIRTETLQASRQLEVAAPAGFLATLLPKGSIAVDGVSLTLDAGPFVRSFTVTLIPETLRETRLGGYRPGTLVNLESDMLAKAARQAAEDQPRTPARRPLTSVQDILDRGWR